MILLCSWSRQLWGGPRVDLFLSNRIMWIIDQWQSLCKKKKASQDLKYSISKHSKVIFITHLVFVKSWRRVALLKYQTVRQFLQPKPVQVRLESLTSQWHRAALAHTHQSLGCAKPQKNLNSCLLPTPGLPSLKTPKLCLSQMCLQAVEESPEACSDSGHLSSIPAPSLRSHAALRPKGTTSTSGTELVERSRMLSTADLGRKAEPDRSHWPTVVQVACSYVPLTPRTGWVPKEGKPQECTRAHKQEPFSLEYHDPQIVTPSILPSMFRRLSLWSTGQGPRPPPKGFL